MNPLDWLKKHGKSVVLWECNKCGFFSVVPERRCVKCMTDMRSDSTKRRLYREIDIEHAIKQQ